MAAAVVRSRYVVILYKKVTEVCQPYPIAHALVLGDDFQALLDNPPKAKGHPRYAVPWRRMGAPIRQMSYCTLSDPNDPESIQVTETPHQPIKYLQPQETKEEVKVAESLEKRFWAKVSKKGPDECWEWLGGKNDGGYGQIVLDPRRRTAGGKRRRRTMEGTHRVAWRLHSGAVPKGMSVLHTCDNPGCVNPSHLFLGTQADNMADMVEKKRQRRGDNHPTAKLTDKEVRAIRREYATGQSTQAELAEDYQVSSGHISNIVKGKYRPHAGGPITLKRPKRMSDTHRLAHHFITQYIKRAWTPADWYGLHAAHAKKILGLGYTVEQVVECLKRLERGDLTDGVPWVDYTAYHNFKQPGWSTLLCVLWGEPPAIEREVTTSHFHLQMTPEAFVEWREARKTQGLILDETPEETALRDFSKAPGWAKEG